MTTEEDFWRALEADPADWDLRLVFADWLEDHGEEVLAAGQRWQAHARQKPDPNFGSYWSWFRLDEEESKRLRYHLDPDLFAFLEGEDLTHGGRYSTEWKDYSSMREADQALARALTRRHT